MDRQQRFEALTAIPRPPRSSLAERIVDRAPGDGRRHHPAHRRHGDGQGPGRRPWRGVQPRRGTGHRGARQHRRARGVGYGARAGAGSRPLGRRRGRQYRGRPPRAPPSSASCADLAADAATTAAEEWVQVSSDARPVRRVLNVPALTARKERVSVTTEISRLRSLARLTRPRARPGYPAHVSGAARRHGAAWHRQAAPSGRPRCPGERVARRRARDAAGPRGQPRRRAVRRRRYPGAVRQAADGGRMGAGRRGRLRGGGLGRPGSAACRHGCARAPWATRTTRRRWSSWSRRWTRLPHPAWNWRWPGPAPAGHTIRVGASRPTCSRRGTKPPSIRVAST